MSEIKNHDIEDIDAAGVVRKDRPVAGARTKPKMTREERKERTIARRLPSAAQRQAPQFLIIGVQRGGTTTFFHALEAHPEIGTSVWKEVHYFDRHYQQSFDWYRAHFPKLGEFPIVGEASPSYLVPPQVPERILQHLPDCKFIVLLRNPIERAYSQYHLTVRRAAEKRSFAEIVSEAMSEEATSSSSAISTNLGIAGLLNRGQYARLLRHWFSIFPRERFLIVRSEDFYANPEPEFAKAVAFLGARQWLPETFVPYNTKSYPPMPDEVRAKLLAFYEGPNRELAELLGRDFDWDR